MVSELRQRRRDRFEQVDLYPVITEEFCAGRNSIEVLDQALAAGVKVVQLREKLRSKGEIFDLAVEYRTRTEKAGALLMINDHVDIALACGADGVHLGLDDLPVKAAREIAPDLLIGASSHQLEQAVEAIDAGADTVNLGPIYPTGTKPEHDTFLGPAKLAEMAPFVSAPFTVMGGIKLENMEPVLAAGARRIAVVTAVTAAADIFAATQALRSKILAAIGR
jgi:thiamine-phosphate pyrophosphorylase